MEKIKKIIAAVLLGVFGGVLLGLLISKLFVEPITNIFTKYPFSIENIMAVGLLYFALFCCFYVAYTIIVWAMDQLTK